MHLLIIPALIAGALLFLGLFAVALVISSTRITRKGDQP